MDQNVLDLLQSHRSIRKYSDKSISDEVLEQLFTSAQWAPSSHNIQAYSIITIRDKKKKQQLADMCGNQKYIETCPVFLVFCIDFYRLKLSSDIYEANLEIDEIENLLVGAVDTALTAENVMIAARSLGLGGVMIGGIRNNPENVSELLQLPDLVVPIIGMCLGYPAQDVWQKPRLPQHVVVHVETYKTDDLLEGLLEYEAISSDYYTRRTNGKRTDGWTKQMAQYLSNPRRPNLKKFIENKGFKLT